jgi:sRNA-binding regulator protein Hfq
MSEQVELKNETENEEQEKIEYYWEQKGKEIKITFLDGKSLVGKLVIAHRYEIVLEIQKEEKPVRVTVMKHAIKYITY